MKLEHSLLGAALLTLGVAARDVPANVRSFYNSAKAGRCTGSDKLVGGFFDEEGGSADWSYCQKSVAGQAIFLHGPSTFANMDIDCDGTQSPKDPRCGASTDTQFQTTFQSNVQEASGGAIDDLNASIHPYVVFGNEGSYSPTFDPQAYGVKPLSVMAVVCGEKLIYGVWGDTNGDDGPPIVGEASLSLATACFGDSVNGNSGHDETDVLYIAFTGDDAVPGSSADWEATSFDEFEKSIAAIGDELIQRLS